jgi:hypothetical protein
MATHVETCRVLIEEIAEHSVAAGEVLGVGVWSEALGMASIANRRMVALDGTRSGFRAPT